MKPKVAYFTNIAPHYREELWLAMAKNHDLEFHFYFGYKPTQSIKSIDFTTLEWKDFKEQIHLVENIEIKNVLVYQTRVLRQILFKKWDVVILLGTARIFTVWISALLARLKGIPVIIWGHGLYGSEKPLKKLFLKTFLSLANVVVVYGDFAKNLIIKENFKEENIKVIYNSINYSETKNLRKSSIQPGFYKKYFENEAKVIVFIGRITRIKKLKLLIEAVAELNQRGEFYNLMIIGDGDERKHLEELSNRLNVNAYFFGECYQENKIAELISNADLCVSPGNVGLTAVHVMSYGTPVCTHDDFTHQMPEFEAIQPWKTGCFYSKNKQNIADTIQEWFQKAKDRNLIRNNCYKIIDTKYNHKYQFKILKNTIDEILKK